MTICPGNGASAGELRRRYESAPLAEWIEEIRGQGNLPRHVAVIMDGNGRWARRRFLPRVAGHRAGRQAVRRTVQVARQVGVEVLTLYVFSQENWKRPETEVRALFAFLHETIAHEKEELDQNGVRLTASGEIDSIPGPAREALQRAMADLGHNRDLVLNLALAYGGRREILRASVRLAERIAAGEVDPDRVTEEDFAAGLYSPELPDPDLVVRTSGEFRLSNFLLWQSAYSEIHVTPVFWPDFGKRDFLLAVADYQHRERRFGALRTDPSLPPAPSRNPLDPETWKRFFRVRS